MNIRSATAAIFLIGLTFTGAARADTVSYADAVTKLAQDCGPDIRKYCEGLNLGNGRIADCLAKNAPKVSPVCMGSLAAVTASISQRQQAQLAYGKVCKHDMVQFCDGLKGDGYILGCLVKAEKHIGKACNQAITDAGWR